MVYFFQNQVIFYKMNFIETEVNKLLTSLEFGNYLQSIRKTQHLSLRKVNELSGISYSHLNMIEHGTRKVTPTILQKLASLYNIDYLDLYEKAGYIEENLLKNAIPYYANIQDYIANSSPAELLSVEGLSSTKSYFAIPMMDDSMLPSIWEKDIVILEASSHFTSGDILLLSIFSQNYVIRKVNQTDKGFMVQAFSKQYEPTFYTMEDFSTQKIKVLGIVRQLRRMF